MVALNCAHDPDQLDRAFLAAWEYRSRLMNHSGSEDPPLLLFGSHINSVLYAGNFDGAVGSMSATKVGALEDEEERGTLSPLSSGRTKRATTSA